MPGAVQFQLLAVYKTLVTLSTVLGKRHVHFIPSRHGQLASNLA